MATLGKLSNEPEYWNEILWRKRRNETSDEKTFCVELLGKIWTKSILMAFLINPHRPPPRHHVKVGTADAAKGGIGYSRQNEPTLVVPYGTR